MSASAERDPGLFNEDLAPVPLGRRTWGIYNYASLWVAMSVCIPTYMLASGLIAGGMSWWQAIGTILLGNLIVLVPMLLNAHAGAKYGIPFPVFVRASFGVRGANIPAVLRALVACGWFGIQTLDRRPSDLFHAADPVAGSGRSPGGVDLLLRFLAAEYGGDLAGHRDHQDSSKASARLHAGRRTCLLLWWITGKAGGLGPVLSTPSKFHDRGVHEVLHSVAHRDGGLLGHRRAQHSGLHALRQIANGRRCWARRWDCPPR